MQEKRICKKCGRELALTLDNFRLNGRNSSGIPYYRSECRECERECAKSHDALRRAKKREEKLQNLKSVSCDVKYPVQRKFKEIDPKRILDISKLSDEINLLGTDEIFVKLVDYKESWISNYGRLIRKIKSKYHLVQGTFLKDNSGLVYQISKNVYIDGKWMFKSEKVYAAQLVADTFIINYDMINNDHIWHAGNNRRNNYYKNLYPMSLSQYCAVRAHFTDTGDDSEEYIFNVMNSRDYRPDDYYDKYFETTVLNIGYHGCREIDWNSKSYEKWSNMIKRCYGGYDAYEKYKGCTVCEEWLNYNNFKLWYDSHAYIIECCELDKDILFKGNKIYSPETCCIVPSEINMLFVESLKKDRKYPIGVYFDKSKNKFRACIGCKGKSTALGTFDTARKAFNAYKRNKENLIKDIANKYFDRIPYSVYCALMERKVEYRD